MTLAMQNGGLLLMKQAAVRPAKRFCLPPSQPNGATRQ
jgi:hypothetical protein